MKLYVMHRLLGNGGFDLFFLLQVSVFGYECVFLEMATHSSVLTWRIPGMGKPGGLPSVGSHRVRQSDTTEVT